MQTLGHQRVGPPSADDSVGDISWWASPSVGDSAGESLLLQIGVEPSFVWFLFVLVFIFTIFTCFIIIIITCFIAFIYYILDISVVFLCCRMDFMMLFSDKSNTQALRVHLR